WGMMDNIAALLVILVAIALVQGKDLEAGGALGLAIALKLYPAILLLAAFPYFARQSRGRARALRFLVGLVLTGFVLILAPFLVFNWDIRGFLSVLADQTSRKPGGISPMGIVGLLYNFGIHSIAGFSLQSVSQLAALRLIWIPAVCLSVVLIAKAGLRSTYEHVFSTFAFVFMIWIMTASWVSEQNVETLLVLLLFQGAAGVFGRAQKWSYGLVSTIVLGFVVFNVPATSFLYPVYEIDISLLSRLGKYALPWIAIAFASYIGVEAVRTGSKIKSNCRHD
ncbi:glycosyltransferase 87 family protein, partial [[Eubacterium] cellulosolvens]